MCLTYKKKFYVAPRGQAHYAINHNYFQRHRNFPVGALLWYREPYQRKGN